MPQTLAGVLRENLTYTPLLALAFDDIEEEVMQFRPDGFLPEVRVG